MKKIFLGLAMALFFTLSVHAIDGEIGKLDADASLALAMYEQSLRNDGDVSASEGRAVLSVYECYVNSQYVELSECDQEDWWKNENKVEELILGAAQNNILDISERLNNVQNGDSEGQEVEFRLEGNPYGTSFDIVPVGVYDNYGESNLHVPKGPGRGAEFSLIRVNTEENFRVKRPDFTLNARGINRNQPVSIGREIDIRFDVEEASRSEDRWADFEEDGCKVKFNYDASTRNYEDCSFTARESWIQDGSESAEFTVIGKGVDNTPGSGLGAQNTMDLTVMRPGSWEGERVTLNEGHQSPEEFSPSVSCTDTVEVSYSENGALSISSAGRTKIVGSPSEGSTYSLGDFNLRVENRDVIDGTIEFTPRCGPEIQ
jgi:hypothetical protein